MKNKILYACGLAFCLCLILLFFAVLYQYIRDVVDFGESRVIFFAHR